MDHGSHTFYLAFDWMAAYPTTLTAILSTGNGHDTEDVFGLHLDLSDRRCVGPPFVDAGVRKVMYTLHGTKGAIRVEDEDVELAVLEAGPGVVAPGSRANGASSVRVAPSLIGWTQARGWFGSLLTSSAVPSRAASTWARTPGRPACASSSSNARIDPPRGQPRARPARRHRRSAGAAARTAPLPAPGMGGIPRPRP